MEAFEEKRVREVFDGAIRLTFTRMLQVEVQEAEKPAVNNYELASFIAVMGEIVGNVAMFFTIDTAHNVISRVLGEEVNENSEIADGLGELVNVITGNAKAALSSGSIRIGFPEVIRGPQIKIEVMQDQHRIDLHYTSDMGPFSLLIAYGYPLKMD